MTGVDVVLVGSVFDLNPGRIVRTDVAISVLQQVGRQFRDDYVFVWLLAVESLQMRRTLDWMVNILRFAYEQASERNPLRTDPPDCPTRGPRRATLSIHGACWISFCSSKVTTNLADCTERLAHPLRSVRTRFLCPAGRLFGGQEKMNE